MIRLVMTDLDDTLIPFGAGRASERAISAIHELLDEGVYYGPVTGRVPATMATMFAGDEACYKTGAFANGQIIAVDGEVIHSVAIDGAHLRRVARILDDLDADAWLATYDPDDLNKVHMVTRHPERVLANPPETWGVSVHGMVDDVEDTGYLKANIQCSCARETMLCVRDVLREHVPELSFVFPSLTAKVIDVNAGSWDKGDSVRLVAEHLGLAPGEVVVFGDAENDLPMIHAFPNSVAVANADADVGEAARWRIGDARDDSVAGALEEIARSVKEERDLVLG